MSVAEAFRQIAELAGETGTFYNIISIIMGNWQYPRKTRELVYLNKEYSVQTMEFEGVTLVSHTGGSREKQNRTLLAGIIHEDNIFNGVEFGLEDKHGSSTIIGSVMWGKQNFFALTHVSENTSGEIWLDLERILPKGSHDRILRKLLDMYSCAVQVPRPGKVAFVFNNLVLYATMTEFDSISQLDASSLPRHIGDPSLSFNFPCSEDLYECLKRLFRGKSNNKVLHKLDEQDLRLYVQVLHQLEVELII